MNPKPKLAFIGRQYHQKTKSDQFMIEFLQRQFEVKVFRREQYSPKGLTEKINLFDPKAVFYWCLPPSVKEHLFQLKCRNHIWAPMWDGFKEFPWRKKKVFAFWKVKTLCFSKVLYEYFHKIGWPSIYWQCFLKPNIPEQLTKGPPYTLFLWQREEKINLEAVVTLIGKENISKVIYKSEIGDSSHTPYPFEIEILKDWISYEDYLSKVRECDFYIAPRVAEGIGFSFIEPMSMGRVVFAYHNSTMNEYIKDGENGYLFDDRFILTKPLKSPQEMLPYIQKYAESFHKEWLQASSDVQRFILD